MLIAEDGAPFSIYLDLEEGKHADLWVVSKASIELISAIKELASFADPSIGVKVTIQSGDEGSLWIKTIVKLVFGIDVKTDEGQVEIKMNTLQAILVGIGLFVGGSVATHYTEMGLQIFDRNVLEIQPDGQPINKSDEAEEPNLPEELHERTREILNGAIRNGIGEAHVRKFYAEIKTDPAIKGVGISYDHSSKPAIIIPRERFAELSKPPEMEPTAGTRSRIERMDLLLTQPRLTADKKAWRFQVGGMEFAAKIADQKFVTEMLSGKLKVPMVEGVYLNADMKIEEEKVGGVWKITARTVTQVHKVTEAPEQASLLRFFQNDEDGDNDEEDS